MICPRTMYECRTASMCAPYNGCTAAPHDKIAKLEERVERLELADARHDDLSVADEAAEEICRLRAERDRLRIALGKIANGWGGTREFANEMARRALDDDEQEVPAVQDLSNEELYRRAFPDGAGDVNSGQS